MKSSPMGEAMKRQKINSMNPSCFDFLTYCCTQSISIFDLFKGGALDSIIPKLQPNWNVLGYCNASELRCRPKDSGYAVMVEDYQETEIVRCWFHLSETEFDGMFEKEK